MPHHADAPVAFRAGSGKRRRHRRIHPVILVIGGAFFDELPARVALKQHKKAQVIQERFRAQQRMHHAFQFILEREALAARRLIDHPPRHKALPVGRKRADARIHAVADQKQLIEDEQIANFRLVGLQLVERRPHICLFIERIFKLQHHQRQAVYKENDVRNALAACAANFQLIDRDKTIRLRVFKIDQHRLPRLRLAIHAIADRHTIAQQRIKGAVALQQVADFGFGYYAHHLLDRLRRQIGIKFGDCLPELFGKNDARHAATGKIAVGGGQIFAVFMQPADGFQLLQTGFFDECFVDFGGHGGSFGLMRGWVLTL